MTIWYKAINIAKKKKKEKKVNLYIKAGKRLNTKESFQCYYIPVIFSDSA